MAEPVAAHGHVTAVPGQGLHDHTSRGDLDEVADDGASLLVECSGRKLRRARVVRAAESWIGGIEIQERIDLGLRQYLWTEVTRS